MPRSRIHVRRDLIAKDKKNGTYSNALGVETSGRRKRYAKKVLLIGPKGEVMGEVIYNPNKPLKCGARAWIETDCIVGLWSK